MGNQDIAGALFKLVTVFRKNCIIQMKRKVGMETARRMLMLGEPLFAAPNAPLLEPRPTWKPPWVKPHRQKA
jgi:hypothetical protein